MVVLCNIKHVLENQCDSSSISLPNLKENYLQIDYTAANVISTEFIGKEPVLPYASSAVYQADLASWKRLTAVDEGCKSVYEVTFDVTGSCFSFRAGDTIGIIPHNYRSEVDEILEHLNLLSQADLEYTLSVRSGVKGAKVPAHIPIKSSINHVLTHCCDIRSVMKKLFLLSLSKYTEDSKERRILEYLASKEGSSVYNTHILDGHMCLLDIFSAFKSCRPPIEVLLANLPRLLPRPYSIVNSGLVNSNVIKICFSVTELDNKRKGLVTGWLETMLTMEKDLEERMKSLTIDGNSKVPIYLRKNISGFTLPAEIRTPLIFIGPGTGVSPYIGFLEERHYMKVKCSSEIYSDVWLFFGCRNPKLDYIYKDEMEVYLNNGTLNKLITSFSRVENSESKYVQDAILQNGEDLVKLMKNGAAIFVCGDSKNMASQVRETVSKCLVKYGGETDEGAERMLSDLQSRKRFLVDAWS